MFAVAAFVCWSGMLFFPGRDDEHFDRWMTWAIVFLIAHTLAKGML